MFPSVAVQWPSRDGLFYVLAKTHGAHTHHKKEFTAQSAVYINKTRCSQPAISKKMADKAQELDELNSELEEAGEPLVPDPSVKDTKAEDDKSGSEKQPDKESDEDDSETENSDGSPKETEEEESKKDDEEKEEEEEESEDEEDETVETHHPKDRATIPYSQFKEETSELKSQRDYWKSKAEEAEGGSKKVEKQAEDDGFKKAIETMATDLGVDATKTERFVSNILELASKRALPKDIQDRLAAIEGNSKQFGEQAKVIAERNHFDNEWSQFLPSLRKEYPNASPEQLEEAREAMDIISHSTKNKFFSMPLDYVFYKTKDDFKDILFSPNKKTFERGRTSMTTSEGKEKKGVVIPSLGEQTPDSMDALEQALADLSEEESSSQGITGYTAEGKKIRLRTE